MENSDFWMGNPVCKDLWDIISSRRDKKIYLYGAGTNGKNFQSCLEIMGVSIAGYIDADEKKWNDFYRGIPIISPYDVIYEKDFIILVTITDKYKKEVFELLDSLGLKKDVDYFIPGKWWGCKDWDLIDPFLGYSRSDSLPGFHVTGNPNAEKKVAILGGSTSDWTISGIRCWVDYFEELVKDKYQIYNGALSGYSSGQELLKCIRDVISLEIDTLIVLSGFNDAMETSKNSQYPMVPSHVDRNLKHIPMERYSRGIAFSGNSAESWVKNMKIIKTVCETFGIRCFIFLQPSYGVSKYTNEFMEEFVKRYFIDSDGMSKKKKFFDYARSYVKEIEYIIDLTDIFDQENQQIYYDHCHYNEYGNRIVAQQIYRYVEAGEDRQ